MAKIALELSQAIATRHVLGTPGEAVARQVADGDGWSISDVLCTSGPCDRPFEERHSGYTVAVVMAGTFQYKSTSGHSLMTPGSLLLGNAGDCFECGHQHATGDRCLAFRFDHAVFEDVAAAFNRRVRRRAFRQKRIPPVAVLSPSIARATAAVLNESFHHWEELAFSILGKALEVDTADTRNRSLPAGASARVTRVLRRLENEQSHPLSLSDLAAEARLSRYHFLRTFQEVTGLTPHQYLLRSRLRSAATRLATETSKVVDIALDCGFGDVSNFNRSFQREFAMSPLQWRSSTR